MLRSLATLFWLISAMVLLGVSNHLQNPTPALLIALYVLTVVCVSFAGSVLFRRDAARVQRYDGPKPYIWSSLK